ncbi:MAG: hypothetical protein IJ420_11300 [Lachnospiraceae bacterium]|nr:hypothetical protein [Lachnospiraceae bacterium]
MKESSLLVNKINELQATYQAAMQEFSEEEKEALQYTEAFSVFYEALDCYIEHSVEKCIIESGARAGDLDVSGVKAQALDEVFGLYGKTPLYESFQPVNGAKFTTYCYTVIKNIVKEAIEGEKRYLLRQMCLNKEELKIMRQWKLHDITKHMVSFEEEEESIVSRIFNNPQKVYEEQCYLQECIEKLKVHMDIVAEGPELKARSTSNKPVYRWIGGSVGAYLSPVMKNEWQDMNWESDEAYKTSSFIQETAFRVINHQTAETLGMVIADEGKDAGRISETELSVTEKLAEQMERVLEPIRQEAGLSAEDISKGGYRKLAQKYYKALTKKYKAVVEADAEFDLAWLWQVIHNLTAEEAAWLFARELGACVPVLKFSWKDSFSEILKEDIYGATFENVTTGKTTQKWPKEIRSKVFQIQAEREKDLYTKLLDDIKINYEELLLSKFQNPLKEVFESKRKGAGGLDGL